MQVTLVAAVDPSVPISSGVTSYVLSLARRLAVEGQAVTLMGFGQHDADADGFEFLPVATSVRNSFEFMLRVASFLRHRKDLQGIVHAQRPDDLVPFHFLANRLPKVLTLHGDHGIHVAAKRGKLAGSAYRLAESYSIARTQAVICVSAGTLECFRERHPDEMSRFHIIPAGIDMDLFHIRNKEDARGQLGLELGSKLVAFVGRFEPEKNPIRVIDEFLKLSAEQPDVHLVLVGEGRLRQAMMQRAREAANRITVSGPLPQEEVAVLLNAADVLVVGSTVEGLPTVAIEALACGTPVVGTSVGVLPEVIRSGINGYIVDSTGGLHTMLRRALSENVWRRDDCRSSVRDFGWDRVVPRVLQVYREIYT